jgi:hypothetical protein
MARFKSAYIFSQNTTLETSNDPQGGYEQISHPYGKKVFYITGGLYLYYIQAKQGGCSMLFHCCYNPRYRHIMLMIFLKFGQFALLEHTNLESRDKRR